MDQVPLDLDFFLRLKTASGLPLNKLKMRGGHYLVFKCPMAENPYLQLPDSFKSRAIKNIVAIKGFVVIASQPWHPVVAKRYWEWDKTSGMEMPRYKTVTMDVAKDAEVKAGQCILYNSYNIGKVKVNGLIEELVIIREIDMMASWSPKVNDTIDLPDRSYTHNFVQGQAENP